ncbi:hypothetical protein Hanom_Chr16g01511991 [Helianthus anomalus]
MWFGHFNGFAPNLLIIVILLPDVLVLLLVCSLRGAKWKKQTIWMKLEAGSKLAKNRNIRE